VDAGVIDPDIVNVDEGGPVDTTRATELPAGTEVPAVGFWLITAPFGTVVLAVRLTAPTARPALVMAVVAAACVWFTTFGTVTGAGPVETTRATELPAGTDVPAVGFWLMTAPLGTTELAAEVTAPTTRPAPVMAVVAAACVWFTTFGTVTGAGPVDTTRATELPEGTEVPAGGFWLTTAPFAITVLDAKLTVPTTRPAPVMAVVAAACVWFTTFGVTTVPELTGAAVISTAAKFHRSVVGAVLFIWTAVPEAAIAPLRLWTQNVSPAGARYWCTKDCVVGSVRAVARSQSFPTAYANEPGFVVVNVTLGAPVEALAVADAPTPEAPTNPTTVNDW
jgi:hypothetical protein